MSNSIWLKKIIEAMRELGGHANYSDLYKIILGRNQIPGLNNKKNPKAQIRGTIESFSSDSDVFMKAKKAVGGNEDIFYSVEGKGSGHWGLRNFTASLTNVDLTEDDLSYPEGKEKLRKHVCRERNPAVIDKAKKLFKQKHGGRLFCEACGFSFSDTYGTIGDDFIEGHHKIPVSQLNENSRTKPEDIIMLCSNCHRMIHRLGADKDALKKLKKIIQEQKTNKFQRPV